MANNKQVLTSRVLEPAILETKQELLMALRAGELKTSKYNLLDENQKLLVEMVCFGGYTAEQAVRVIDPSIKSAASIARRLMSDQNVMATIEELSKARDNKFMADINNARDMALAKLKYIMSTTDDDALAASVAKVILDKSESVSKLNSVKDEQVGGVVFKIQVDNNYIQGAKSKDEEPIIIELTPDEENRLVDEARMLNNIPEPKDDKVIKESKIKQEIAVNPVTGLPYTLMYEGVNNYKK